MKANKRIFKLINGPLPGYTGTTKSFKAALISIFGASYYKHFTRISMNKIMNKNTSSIVISKIINNANCLINKSETI